MAFEESTSNSNGSKNKAQLVTELAEANEIITQLKSQLVTELSEANEIIAQLKSQLKKRKREDSEKCGKNFKDFEVFKQQTNKEIELLKQEVKSLNVKSVKKN